MTHYSEETPPTQTLTAALDALRRGDSAQAWAELAKSQRWAHWVVRRFGRDCDPTLDHEDLAQEAILIAYEALVLAAAFSAHGSAALHEDGSAARRCCGGHDRTTEAREDRLVRERA